MKTLIQGHTGLLGSRVLPTITRPKSPGAVPNIPGVGHGALNVPCSVEGAALRLCTFAGTWKTSLHSIESSGKNGTIHPTGPLVCNHDHCHP